MFGHSHHTTTEAISSSSATELSLRVMFNKPKNKVVFAEAGSDFVDILLSFLTLPLGKVVRLLKKHYGAPAFGSISSLYRGLSDLDAAHFCAAGAKEMLLNPQSSFIAECLKLALYVTDNASNRYFLCRDEVESSFRPNEVSISICRDVTMCDCGRFMHRPLAVVGGGGGGAFVTKQSSFIITDDLCVAPMTVIFQTINKEIISETQGMEMYSVRFGIDEFMELLHLCLTSATPLTDMIIGKFQSSLTAPKVRLHHVPNDDEADTRKIALKVFLQNSTNKFLYAFAMDDFVELLFSFLTVPLGGVEFLLGGKTGLKCIDNLYTSVSDEIHDKYFASEDIKNRLINPKVAHGFISKNQFLPLIEDAPPRLFYIKSPTHWRQGDEISVVEKSGTILISSVKVSKEIYVKKQAICLVTDDLTVSYSLATSMSIINGFGVDLNDVKEMELHIGVKEALDILKASLTSKTALTDALINPMLNQEELKR